MSTVSLPFTKSPPPSTFHVFKKLTYLKKRLDFLLFPSLEMNMSTMGDVREQGSIDGMVADYLLPVPVWQNEVYRRYVAVGEVIADEFGIGVEELPSIPGNRALGPRGQIAFDTMDGEKR